MNVPGEAARRGANFHALIALTLAAPLPFGAYPAWAWASMSAACGALLFGWGLSALTGRTRVTRPPSFLWWSAAALGLALLWALLQTAEFVPAGWRHPMWRDAAAALEIPHRGAISLDPAASRASVLRVLSYAGVFWLAYQYGRDSRRASYAFRALTAGSACYALYGLVVVFSGAESILWFEKTSYVNAATGTFVNPNSFGAYCGIGLLCATAVLQRRFFNDALKKMDFRERLRFLLVAFIPRNALLLAAWMTLASALLFSLSRGATAATILAILAMLAILALRRGLSLRKLMTRKIGILLAGGLPLLLAADVQEWRIWEIGPDLGRRSEIYSQTLMAIGEAPLAGTGLGTFESVYRSHRTGEIRPGVLMAHNDYLELALELGIPAAALFVFAVFALGVGCARGVWIRNRDFEFPAAGAAVCVLMGAHSLIDFSLQIPAVAVTFSFVLGVAVAQSQPVRSAA